MNLVLNRIFCSHKSDGFWWFRVFGIGLHGKDISKNPPMFSDRNFVSCYLQINKWRIKFIK